VYIILQAILVLSISLIAGSVTDLLCNAWLKKHYKEQANYDKEDTKIMIKILLCSIGGTIVSALFLLLKMY